jgi:alpha-D-xyloside xylohydrolase
MNLTRRVVAKGIAAGTAAGLSGLLRAESATRVHTSPATEGASQTLAWRQVFTGGWRARLGMPERITPVSTRLVPPQAEAFAKLPRVEAAPLVDIRGGRTERGCVVQLPLRPNEHIFGLGLQFLSFDQRGKKKVARVNADPKFDTGDSHAPVPFYVTTEGIGILVDTARYANFYFGDARPKPDHPVASVSNSNPDPNYTHNLQDGDAGQVTVEVPHAAGVDVYLFAGPTMMDAVRRYIVFSGGGALPPDWGLGFWYRADARATQQSALALMQEFRDRKIPCDVLGLEPGWQTPFN